ncbi:MAG: hypothetical protein AAB354_04690 [candidate division KSB1 bacterium]
MTRIAERQKTQTPQDGYAQTQEAFEEKSSQKEDSLSFGRFAVQHGKTPFTFPLISPRVGHDSPQRQQNSGH